MKLYQIILLTVLLTNSRLYAQFTAQPEDITAVEGETVKFSCILQESNSSPIWIINNILYHRINLGGNYRYEKDGLTVLNVELSMNNTSFQCITPTAESTVGILYVKQQIPTSTFHPPTRSTTIGIWTTTSCSQTSQSQRVSVEPSQYITQAPKTKQFSDSTLLLVVSLTSVSAVFICICIMVVAVCLACIKHKGCKSKSAANTSDKIQLEENEAYQSVQRRMNLTENPAYEMVQR